MEGKLYPLYIDLPSIKVFTLFFPCSKPNAPILLYNPGGPGGSGTESMLLEYAPYILGTTNGSKVTRNNKHIVSRRNSGYKDLTSRYNLLYLDFPSDTGFSIDKTKGKGIYGDTHSIGIVIHSIETILKIHNLVGYPIEFFGFSYAGKIWPLVAKELILRGHHVTGMAIFSGYTDPILQEIRPISEYLLYTGIITNEEYKHLESETNRIENLIHANSLLTKWREVQSLYESTVGKAWDMAGADTYDIRRTQNDNGGKEEDDSPLNDIHIRESLGVSAPYHPSATTFDTTGYEGFLLSATDALKFIADKGVFIFYCMGSLDGASLAKGTKDMLEETFKVQPKEKRWTLSNGTILGKIGQVCTNVFYGIVIGTGHSFDTEHGDLAQERVMQFLYDKHI